MIKGVNFIGFSESRGTGNGLQYTNSVGQVFEPLFYTATRQDVEKACILAQEAFEVYSQKSDDARANFLDEIGNQIDLLGDELIERASAETGLPEGRFHGERSRTTSQLRLFAKVLRRGGYNDPRIDTADLNRQPLPKADIRFLLNPIGPIAVFAASNFPLAFSTAGGDTASALAAGCPVILKSHQAHPGVNDLVSQAIIKAAKITGMPEGVFSSINGPGRTIGKSLVLNPALKGVAFTGSTQGGLALQELARTRSEPIPVFAEMGSLNPVVVSEDALNDRTAEILAASIKLGAGQFCTNPGLLIVKKSDALDLFQLKLAELLEIGSTQQMLTSAINRSYELGKEVLACNATQLTSQNCQAGLFSIKANQFINNEQMKEEVFGPLSILVECENFEEVISVISSIQGQLTGSIFANNTGTEEVGKLFNVLKTKVGRIIFNNAPTGVEVCDSMHHGGPFPATTDSRYTSVGTAAILRFLRPVCYQNTPDGLLPDALKNENPLGIQRKVNGVFTNSLISEQVVIS